MTAVDAAPFVIAVLVYAAGFGFAIRAAATAHTAQGAVAWAIALIVAPWIVIPFFVVFGPPRFYRRGEGFADARIAALDRAKAARLPRAEPDDERLRGPLERLAPLPTLACPNPTLILDGEPIFDAAFDLIERAERRLSLQFYIINDDGLGRRFRDALIDRARAGVTIRLLYDSVGSRRVPSTYWRALSAAGVELRPFALGKLRPRILQLNYRNHRKLVVMDGREALIGGANVGDEYLGLSSYYGPWRDTALGLSGPAATAVEASFVEDWLWAGGDAFADPADETEGGAGETPILILPTGPADPTPACTLALLHLIGEARNRFWIASPYFVPDLDLFSALKLAALRGVDVKVLIPDKPDHKVVWLAAFAYADEASAAGVSVRRYDAGFMHQKALVVDDRAAAIGTVNIDPRSLRLNFEMTAVVFDRAFAEDVATMLEADFARSIAHEDSTMRRRLPIRLLSPVARLASPLL